MSRTSLDKHANDQLESYAEKQGDDFVDRQHRGPRVIEGPFGNRDCSNRQGSDKKAGHLAHADSGHALHPVSSLLLSSHAAC